MQNNSNVGANYRRKRNVEHVRRGGQKLSFFYDRPKYHELIFGLFISWRNDKTSLVSLTLQTCDNNKSISQQVNLIYKCIDRSRRETLTKKRRCYRAVYVFYSQLSGCLFELRVTTGINASFNQLPKRLRKGKRINDFP